MINIMNILGYIHSGVIALAVTAFAVVFVIIVSHIHRNIMDDEND